MILGIDTGWNNIGFALFNPETEEFTKLLLINALSLNQHYLFFYSFINHNKVKKVYLETPFFTQKTIGNNIHVLEAIAVEKLAIEQHKIHHAMLSPGTVKKRMCGNGKATKNEMVSTINKKFNLKISIKDHHIADACGIAYTGFIDNL